MFFVLAALLVGGFIVLSNDPLNDTVNFLIAGSIPGTNIALGFWPTIGLVAIMIFGIKIYLNHLNDEYIEHTAKLITEEKRQEDFKNTYGSHDPKLRNSILGSAEFDNKY